MTLDTKSTDGTTNNESTDYEGSNDFLKAYARLRTVLDSLQITSLRYCLEETNPVARIKRAKEIEVVLMPIIKEFESRMLLGRPPSSCPDGFFNCGGCCVPYPCID